jgi:FlaA1/EpsC-like NDP-sugar epimerase
MGMKKKEINYQLLIRRICLIVLDIICIIAASILALLTRFEFDFSQIPKEFLKVIYKYGPFTIVITLIIFSLFRIYSSLWEYAGIEEVFSLIAACLVAAVAKIVIILFTWSVMPRSWYVLDTIYRGNKSILPTDTSAQTEPYIPMVKEKESHDHRRRRGRKKSDHRDPEQ